MGLGNAIKTKIYVLYDESDYPRYVGKTANDLHDRLQGHLLEARKGSSSYKSRWIRSMIAKGFTPSISLIVEVDGRGNEAEISYIKFFKEKGARLTNLTDGGDGWSKGKKHSPESIEKRAAMQRGIKWTARKRIFCFWKRNPDLIKLYGINTSKVKKS